MIQKEGKIQTSSVKELNAVVEAINTKYGHCVRVSRLDRELAVIWDDSEILFCSDTECYSVPPHTLSDFNLLPGGEPMLTFKNGDRVVCDDKLTNHIRNGYFKFTSPDVKLSNLVVKNRRARDKDTDPGSSGFSMSFNKDGSVTGFNNVLLGRILHAPTFGHLKAGDPNPFVVGMEVIYGSDHRAIVRRLSNDPAVELEWENKVVGTYGFYPDGEQRNRNVDINTIFPTTQEQPAHKYEFGDKVKVEGLTDPRYVFAHSNGFVALMKGATKKSIEGGEAKTLHTCIDTRVTPWPEPVTINLSDNSKVTAHSGKIDLNDSNGLGMVLTNDTALQLAHFILENVSNE